MPATDSPHAAFGALIGQTARQWRRAADFHLQPFGLTEATWLPLLCIARAAEPMWQKDLAAALSLDGSSVVRLVDTLEQAGLVARQEDAGDRRAKAIALTGPGQALARKVEAVVRRVREDALAGLPQADVDTTLRVLRQVCDALAASMAAKGEEGARV
ncbi:MarR family transcriptional regulator [Ramlibacter sp. H39-3-26]|uniref:MarR family winged helix-turn-helix transcriptional regulator n=1 Tax=Curvibacter soli TaxID=3031331 RepID=UPI0023DBB24F|nr:MarR family transcriptional regulator [Ramlibacter sp. H39-3-26]MDF1485531.1 MarR family transcriptional regulator [Ramlibacter sp. H39-3-26]